MTTSLRPFSLSMPALLCLFLAPATLPAHATLIGLKLAASTDPAAQPLSPLTASAGSVESSASSQKTLAPDSNSSADTSTLIGEASEAVSETPARLANDSLPSEKVQRKLSTGPLKKTPVIIAHHHHHRSTNETRAKDVAQKTKDSGPSKTNNAQSLFADLVTAIAGKEKGS